MKIEALYDQATNTITYVVWDKQTREALIIDPVMDYDPASSTLSYASTNKVLELIKKLEVNVSLILETHAHADHVSGSEELKKHLPNAKLAIGEEITSVQKTFKEIFNFGSDFRTDGSQFDRLIADGEKFKVGTMEFQAIYTPGHTPACYCYKINDVVFTGDALFMPDFGVARCDFPGGSAETLYTSITEKLYTLPDDTRYYTAHDYQPGGRELRYEATIGESKKNNIHLKVNTNKEEFINFRTNRDKTLNAPRLLLPSIQINANGGHLQPVENNGVSYIKLPVRFLNG